MIPGFCGRWSGHHPEFHQGISGSIVSTGALVCLNRKPRRVTWEQV